MFHFQFGQLRWILGQHGMLSCCYNVQQIDHLTGARAVMDVVRDDLLDLMIQFDIGSQCHRLVIVISISEYAVYD